MRWLSPLLFLLLVSCASKGPGPHESAAGTPPGETGTHEASVGARPSETRMHQAAVGVPPGESVAPRDSAAAPQAGDCQQGAIRQLKALDPDGYSIYEQTDDKQFFSSWIT